MKAIILIIFAAMVIFVITWYWQEWKKTKRNRENIYNMKYLWIEDNMENLAVNEDNFRFIRGCLCELGNLKHKNREKTCVLTTKFYFGRFMNEAIKDARK